jgi:hypothetical protein
VSEVGLEAGAAFEEIAARAMRDGRFVCHCSGEESEQRRRRETSACDNVVAFILRTSALIEVFHGLEVFLPETS